MYVGLRRIRKKKQVPVLVLARLLDLKTEAAYYKKESGIIKFSVEEARKIAGFFEMSIEDIFFGETLS
jgi:DNA-binding XRE family transcriptional regulator